MTLFRGRWEPRLLGVAAAVACGLWLFVEVAEEVVEGDTQHLDHRILAAVHAVGHAQDPLGPPWLIAVARDLTALGSTAVITLLVAAASLFLLMARQRRTALFVIVAISTGGLAMKLMKQVFGRARPELFPHGDWVTSLSFPSGHAMLSAIVYPTLGALLAQAVETRRLKLFIMAMALCVTVLVGITRVFLGVHWPSDVLAGWAAGTTWALAWWGAAEWWKAADKDRSDAAGSTRSGLR